MFEGQKGGHESCSSGSSGEHHRGAGHRNRQGPEQGGFVGCRKAFGFYSVCNGKSTESCSQGREISLCFH